MRLVDANVLLYAVNASSVQHETARSWLDGALAGGDTVGFAWNALLAFARLTTNQRIFANPLTADEAMDQVNAWLSAPSAHVLQPGERHPGILRDLLSETGTAGNLVNDAHLAALAIEHRAEVVTYDADFRRFAGVRSRSPADLQR